MSSKGKEIADGKDSSGKRKRDDNDITGRRKRTNPAVLQFFEDSAWEVDESGSSDDDGFLNDLFQEDEFDADVKVKTEPAKTPDLPFFPKEEEMSGEELEKMLEERYKPGSSYVKYAEDGFEANRSHESNIFMSSAREPTIWKVKCMVGRERHSSFCLMQKYVDLHTLGTKLQIISAFAVEHVKGFIYIEADKQCDINEACKGICSIYSSRVAPVPMNEVSNLFSVRRKYSGISVGTWARVKNGKYKGDLAQVVAVNEAQKKATVKLVPRIDLQAMAEKFGGGVTGKKTAIPTPRLISSSELEDFRPLIQYRRDRDTGNIYEVFDGMMLKDGYLFKKVSLDSLSFWGVTPSEAELIKFEPPKDNESTDVEWLTGLFGERKKKQIIRNDKGGEKGEGSSSSMGNSFEVHDLVFHGRKGFGVVIGMEKDDKFRILQGGSDRPVVVSIEPRLLKKASFDKKFTALDHQKKTISINDTVRVLEGPLEDRQGIVKQIYKGVIFLHDENEQDNGGYFCAKAHICEKNELFGDACKGKGGKSEASGFDDFSSSPKSPLSPKKPWEARDNNRSFNREDKDRFSVGQSLRIRVGPLKGYLCRVLAIRYSDVTVKLDSQQKILTVKSEHLSEVRGKSSGVSLGEEQDSAKPFELLGTHDGSQGWIDGGVASTESGGWNNGGPSTERSSSWVPFPSSGLSLQPESSSANALNSMDIDLNKDAGASAWETKVTPSQNSAWGASAAEEKAVVNTEQGGGWAKATSNIAFGNSGASSWGTPKTSSGVQAGPLNDAGDNWGSAKLKLGSPADISNDVTASWGKNSNASNNEDGGWKKPEEPWDKGKSILGAPPSSWGNADAGKNPVDSWAKEKDGGSGQSTWGKAVKSLGDGTSKGHEEDSWGKAADKSSNKDGSSGSKSAWNSAAPASQTGGWGNAVGSSAQSNVEASGWNKDAAVSGGQTEKWGSMKKDGEDRKGGWGKGGFGNQGQSDSWGKNAVGADGGSSWNNKQDGGSSWNNHDGGSTWNKQDAGGSSWSKSSGGWSSQDNQADNNNNNTQDESKSWGRSNTFEGGRGSGGRRGRGGGWGGGRDGFGRGRSFDRDQSTGNGSSWNGGQSSGWGNSKAFDGGNKDDGEAGGGWKKGAGGSGDQTGSWGNNKKNEGEGTTGWGKSEIGNQGKSGGWNKTEGFGADGGSSRNNKQEGGSADGGSSWNKQEGGSSWNKQGGGGSSWGKQLGGGSTWSREADDSTEYKQAGGSWQRSNDFGGDRGGFGGSEGGRTFGGRTGRGDRGGRGERGGRNGFGRGGRSFDRDQSSGGWSKGQDNNYGTSDGTSTGGGNLSSWSSGQGRASSWGNSNKNDNAGTSGWKNGGDETGKWGCTKKEGEATTTTGWGKGQGVESDSWSKPKNFGGDGGSWSKPGGGGSSWNNNNQGGDGGSSWNNKQDGGGSSSWSKPAWNNNQDDNNNRTFEGGRGSVRGRGRGGFGRGGRDNNYGRGGGRSFSQCDNQSSGWKGGNYGRGDQTSTGNASGWGNSSGQAGGWGNNSKSFDGNTKDDQLSTGNLSGWGTSGQASTGNASGWGSSGQASTGNASGWGSSGQASTGNASGWGNSSGQASTGNASGWGNSSGQASMGNASGSGNSSGHTGGWGSKKDDAEGSDWKKPAGATGDQTSTGNASGWGNTNVVDGGKKDNAEGSGWKRAVEGNQTGNWGSEKKDGQGATGWGKGGGNW